jgi:Na+/proline symporter
MLQRGLQAGITVYAPAIILSTVLHWRTDVTIVLTGIIVILYTASGGSEAVNLTQKYQFGVIFCGMIVAFVVLLFRLPSGVGFREALTLGGAFGKLQGVDFSLDVNRRYTFWSGLLGGFFLALSYFGTDQSQVQRYLSGASLRESRLGLIFNAVLKIPMQFFILLLGTMVFVFYQFEPPPVYFNQAVWESGVARDPDGRLNRLQAQFDRAHEEKRAAIETWISARQSGNDRAESAARGNALEAHQRSLSVRAEARAMLESLTPRAKTPDTDYVFITFVLHHLPQGIVGLLMAAFFAATLSSKAAELNALASTTTVDLYQFLVKRQADDSHFVAASRWFTVIWGGIAVGFALFAGMAENLVQAVNIVASIFYGVVLALFLVAFFFRWVGGTAVFWAAVAAQLLVFALFARLSISYLWYNLIGCGACIAFSIAIQALLGPGSSRAEVPEGS